MATGTPVRTMGPALEHVAASVGLQSIKFASRGHSHARDPFGGVRSRAANHVASRPWVLRSAASTPLRVIAIKRHGAYATIFVVQREGQIVGQGTPFGSAVPGGKPRHPACRLVRWPLCRLFYCPVDCRTPYAEQSCDCGRALALRDQLSCQGEPGAV